MNTKSGSKDFSNQGGSVNVYSLTIIPLVGVAICQRALALNGNVPEFTTYEYCTNFQEVAPTQASLLAEFQGESYLPWGGPRGGW
jgi:hypothetical protein